MVGCGLFFCQAWSYLSMILLHSKRLLGFTSTHEKRAIVARVKTGSYHCVLACPMSLISSVSIFHIQF